MYEILTQILTKARGMWRYRWYTLILAAIASIVGWVVVYQLPDQYESEARIYIDTQTALKPLMKGLTVEKDDQDKILLMTKALLSRPNLEAVIRETDLNLRAKTPAQVDGLIKALQKNVGIESQRKQQNFYTIRYSDKDPNMAKRVVQALLDSLVEETLGTNRADTQSAQQFLIEQIKDYEERLIKSERRLADFKKQHVGLMPSESGGYYPRLQNYVEQLQKIQSKIVIANNRRDELLKQLKGEEESIGTLELQNKIQQRKIELNNLLLKYTDEHPDVIALKDIIAQLGRRNIDQAGKEHEEAVELSPVYQKIKLAMSDVEVELASLHAEETGQKQQIESLQQLVDTMPEVEADLARLNRDYEVTKAQYEALVTRLESAKLSEGIEKSGDNIKFRVIDPPILPLKPSSPNRLVLVALVMMIGLGVGLGLAFLLNELYAVFCTTDELNEYLGLPVLGVVTMKWSLQERVRLKKDLLYLIAGFSVLFLLFVTVVSLEVSGVFVAQTVETPLRGLV